MSADQRTTAACGAAAVKVRDLIVGDEIPLVRTRKVMTRCESLPRDGEPVSLDGMDRPMRNGAAAPTPAPVTGLDTSILVRCSVTEPRFIGREVLVELVWVLERAYGQSAAETSASLTGLLEVEEPVLEKVDDVATAAMACGSGIAGFADHMIAQAAVREGCGTSYTFDREAARLNVVTLGVTLLRHSLWAVGPRRRLPVTGLGSTTSGPRRAAVHSQLSRQAGSNRARKGRYAPGSDGTQTVPALT